MFLVVDDQVRATFGGQKESGGQIKGEDRRGRGVRACVADKDPTRLCSVRSRPRCFAVV